jgi:hypothetical protein
MSLGLTAILYFYMKQKLYVIESRLNTLTDLTQTLANEFCKSEVKTISNLPLDPPPMFNIESESENDSSDESDDESSSSDESESEDGESIVDLKEESENKIQTIDLNTEHMYTEVPIFQNLNVEVVKLSSDEIPSVQLNTKILPIDLNETLNISKLIEVSDDESVTKHVNVSVDYSALSLKELKQKVNDLGGPPLKTKNALLNFLKNKV